MSDSVLLPYNKFEAFLFSNILNIQFISVNIDKVLIYRTKHWFPMISLPGGGYLISIYIVMNLKIPIISMGLTRGSKTNKSTPSMVKYAILLSVWYDILRHFLFLQNTIIIAQPLYLLARSPATLSWNLKVRRFGTIEDIKSVEGWKKRWYK